MGRVGVQKTENGINLVVDGRPHHDNDQVGAQLSTMGCLALALILVVIWVLLWRARSSARRATSIRSSCRTAEGQGSVLVVIPSMRADLTARAIFSVFERAACPGESRSASISKVESGT